MPSKSTLVGRSFFAFVVVVCLHPGRALAHEVVVRENIAYKSGPGLSEYERQRCALDLYLPDGASGFSSLVWFHGGGLTEGDKAGGLEVQIARSLAARGIAVVMVNYRLSGRVTFPRYVEDAAASVAWVLDHIEEYRGARDRVFVSGHSAGGYLAAMVGLDPRYLAAHRHEPGDLAGLIPISGQTVTHATVREERGLPPGQPVVDGAAPVHYVRRDAPPVLAIAGSEDNPARPEENGYLIAAMKAAGHRDATYLEFEGRTHGTIISGIPDTDDPVGKAIVDFIGRHADSGGRQQPRNLTVDNDGTVHVPALAVPPTSFLSPEGKTYLVDHLQLPQRPELRAEQDGVPRFLAEYLTAAKKMFPVERDDTTIAGVHAYVYTPRAGIAERNRNRVLINLHGGGFSGCWPACAELEAIPVAGQGRIRVVSLDYRQGPKHRFPAASEDVAAVYRELLKTHRPENVGIYGCSAGGLLAGMAVAWFQRNGLPVPGALGIFCAGLNVPGEPYIGDGDYFATALGEGRVGFLPPATSTAYFRDIDIADPLVNPIKAPDMLARFPPSLIVTGTRAMELSSAVYAHSQLVKHGAQSELHVWEGMFHGFFYNPTVPESRECLDVIVKFFDRRLGSRVRAAS